MPIHVVDTVAGFFDGVGKRVESTEPEFAEQLRRMVDPATAAEGLRALPVDEMQRAWFEALLRNTAAPTMMEGSNSRWALPSEARLTLNGRVLPGLSMADYEQELQAILGPGVEYRIEGFKEGTECQVDTPVVDSIQRVMARRNPGVPVIPDMTTGGTERGLLKDVGVQCYGFWPRRFEPEVPPGRELGHGVDERISVDNLLFATRCLFEIVCDINGIDP